LGKDMPVINSYDINGALKEIPMDANSIYLIDYWASWCIPCIANLPAIRDFKSRFEKKDFKIISISLDTKYNNWLAAIKKHNINWDNYCNLNGFNATDVKAFGFTSIPFTLLIDNGKIVGFNPSNKEIEEYLLSL
jgi:thiol-disulfide isomerase/thioredoxin